MPRRAEIPAVPLVRTDLEEPTLRDRYELRSVLGSGGMGTVWEAWDLRLDRRVALKILRDDLPPSAAARLEREARAAARIRDRRVVTVLDLDRTPDGHPYLVLECHESDTLADELQSGPLPPEQLDRLVDDLLGALGAAHACSVLHRDVKPANVLRGADGYRVTDFGLASLDDDETTETDLMGTLVYVAPERLDGARGTARSDVFSAAVVLYEAASGVQPFRAEHATESIARLRAGDAPPLPEHLPIGLRRTLEAAMSPDPARRPADAAAMLAAIREGGPDADPTIALDATDVLPTAPARSSSAEPSPTREPMATPAAGPIAAPTSAAPAAGAGGPSLRDRLRAAVAEREWRPELLFGALAATVLVVLLLAVALDSSDGGGSVPTGEAGATEPADPPAGLDGTLDRIEELGR